MKQLIIPVLCTFATVAQAQQAIVKGKVVDEQKRPIPYANIGLPGNEPGTATNEAGEFSLRVPSLPQKLTVVSMGYTPTTIEVTTIAAQTIVLPTSNVALPEVRVRNPDQVATELVQRAFAQLQRHARAEQYGKAFYRQKERHNAEYSEFLDAFYNVRFTNKEVVGWELEQARYGLVPDKSGVDMTNFSAAIRLIPVFEPKPSRRTLAVPLSPLAAQQFTFHLREVLQDKDQETAVIDYAPRQDLGQPGTEGTLYIDMETATLRRQEARVPIGDLMSYQFGAGTTLQAQTFKMVSDFSPVADSLSRLQSVRAEQTIVLNYQNKPDTTQIAGQLFFYQYTGKPSGKAYKSVGVNYNDLKQVMKQRYDSSFWLNREVLRASPVEERVIRDMEQRKAFGSF
ncbi:carboxypeptidase-like regulatory domain-containing protein [Hymenobacter fodinae]|uniref:Carboxypeptidase-like regulatory domain-containing protein n=1 Tax=Hymenobacter fodinae TaxID=2510796 RepID=A0A4Z0P722_9BACT|nr:carboxypeptidase-like regulatory domain-containing protein [Hymenobacter fodinae]TGE08214.1 carboxypeptidase-like regulatory domain-containing protein [Hymenobacter fodinae]